MSILGTVDANAILRSLDDFCRARLGSELAEVTSCVLSVGAGFGLTLADGRQVFLKAWSPATSLDALVAVHDVQVALARRDFPAPVVLVAPAPFMGGHASAMELLDRGTQLDASQPAVRQAMAVALARLIALAAPYTETVGLPKHEYPEDAVWGTPHNVLFDFATTGRGAEWIDAVAATSIAILRHGDGRRVLGHRDWSVKNMRFEHGAVSAVYDWDSLVIAREPEIVGMAAATFTTTWDIPVARALPTRSDMRAFVTDYEAAAGRVFSAGEWRTVAAAASHVLAYTARCEHATGSAIARDSARWVLLECVELGPLR